MAHWASSLYNSWYVLPIFTSFFIFPYIWQTICKTFDFNIQCQPKFYTKSVRLTWHILSKTASIFDWETQKFNQIFTNLFLDIICKKSSFSFFQSIEKLVILTDPDTSLNILTTIFLPSYNFLHNQYAVVHFRFQYLKLHVFFFYY